MKPPSSNTQLDARQLSFGCEGKLRKTVWASRGGGPGRRTFCNGSVQGAFVAVQGMHQLALAEVMHAPARFAGRPVAVICSGGNVSPDQLRELLADLRP